MRIPDKATDAMQYATELAPENVLWRNDLGIMYKENGKLSRAQDCFEQPSAPLSNEKLYAQFVTEFVAVRQLRK